MPKRNKNNRHLAPGQTQTTQGPKAPVSSAGPDFLCILDFEATCNNGKRPRPQEIIEFPTVLVDAHKGKIIKDKVFHYYIRPDINPVLSSFCTELTGITQEVIDESGIPLADALLLHTEWLKNEVGALPWHLCSPESRSETATFLYVTCGDWDLQKCLPEQLGYHGRCPGQSFCAWINLKHVFASRYRQKCKGMAHMLDHFGMELEGRHHSGIDDCKNIARICRQMIRDGWTPKGPTSSSGYK